MADVAEKKLLSKDMSSLANMGFYRLRVVEFVHFPFSVGRVDHEILDSS